MGSTTSAQASKPPGVQPAPGTRAHYEVLVARRLHAFRAIGATLGKAHPVTTLMGGLAWGRHDFERGPTATLRDTIEEFAYLEGVFCVLNTWARDHDRKAQCRMLDLWPRGRGLA